MKKKKKKEWIVPAIKEIKVNEQESLRMGCAKNQTCPQCEPMAS